MVRVRTRMIVAVALCVAILSIMMSSGCALPFRRPAPTPPAPERTVPGPAGGPAAPRPGAQAAADKLRAEAENVPGVKSAVVVVAGKTAMVGIDLEPGIDKARAEGIKKQVADRLRTGIHTSAPGVTAVSVTEDPDLVTRLRRIAEGLTAGQPISTFRRELDEITRRISTVRS